MQPDEISPMDSSRKHRLQRHFPWLTRRRFLSSLFLGIPAMGIGNALGIEPKWVSIRNFKRPISGFASTTRFVHLTDIHFKGDEKFFESIVEKVNRLNPEFICFTGDLIEEKEHEEKALEIIREFKAPVYGIPGNHDYWAGADFDRFKNGLQATGGDWLMDESVDLKSSNTQLIGATCQKPMKPNLQKDRKSILLIHYPEWADRFAPKKFDLILAGHSHGGQVRLPGIGSLIVPYGTGAYDLGFFQTKGGPLYVSSGIGWFYLPIRFLCRPEIVVFEI